MGGGRGGGSLGSSEFGEAWRFMGSKGSLKGSFKGSIGSLELGVFGGSWVVIPGVISPLIWVVGIVTLLIAPLSRTSGSFMEVRF